MRKIRTLRYDAPVGALASAASSFNSLSECGPETPINLSDRELRVGGKEGAGFEMEEPYWESLQDICKSQHLTRDEFIALAIDQRPHMPEGEAVQLAIVAHFRGLTRPIQTDQALPHSVLEQAPMIRPGSRRLSQLRQPNKNLLGIPVFVNT